MIERELPRYLRTVCCPHRMVYGMARALPGLSGAIWCSTIKLTRVGCSWLLGGCCGIQLLCSRDAGPRRTATPWPGTKRVDLLQVHCRWCSHALHRSFALFGLPPGSTSGTSIARKDREGSFLPCLHCSALVLSSRSYIIHHRPAKAPGPTQRRVAPK